MNALNLLAAASLVLLAATPTTAKEPVAAQPIGSPGNWVLTDDYPTSSLRADEQGVVGFVLQVGPDGLVKSCAVGESSGYPVLDGATCSLISLRARFAPATDKRGRAVAGLYKNRVRWVLPDDAPEEPPVAGDVVLNFIVNADGSTTDCVFSGSGMLFEDKAGSGDLCNGLPKMSQPYLDDASRPVRKRVTMRMSTMVEDVP